MTITITHTYADGTLLDGTTREETRKGSPAREILQRNAWRWKPSYSAWGQLSSADKPARQHRIDATAAALREIGYEVVVEVDNTPRDMATAEADRAAQMDARVDAIAAKANRRAVEAQGRDDAARRVLDHIPMGQPMLVDHHSYAGDRRRRERAWANQDKAHELRQEAEYHAKRAETSSRHMDRRYGPRTVARRVERLETEVRRMRNSGGNPDYLAMRENELSYWRKVRDEQVKSGDAIVYGPDTISKGDYVSVSGMWREVVRVNQKTVTVQHEIGTCRVPYHDITGHRPA